MYVINTIFMVFIRLAYMIGSGQSNNGCLTLDTPESSSFSPPGWMSSGYQF